jgi:hypothetical protein
MGNVTNRFTVLEMTQIQGGGQHARFSKSPRSKSDERRICGGL